MSDRKLANQLEALLDEELAARGRTTAVINKQIESKEAQLELVGKVVPTTKAPAPKKKAPKLRRKVSIKGAPAPDGYEWGATY